MQQLLRQVKDICDISIYQIYLIYIDVCALLLPMFFGWGWDLIAVLVLEPSSNKGEASPFKQGSA